MENVDEDAYDVIAVTSTSEMTSLLLKGVMDIDIPSQARIVRIFTSSTFTGKKNLLFMGHLIFLNRFFNIFPFKHL